MFIETVFAAASQFIGQPLGIGRRNKDIGDPVLDSEPGGRTEDGIRFEYQMMNDARFFAAQQEMTLAAKVGQGNIHPPTLIIDISDHLGKLGVAGV